MAGSRLTRDDVVRVLGPTDDVRITQIIATGATLEDLMVAASWAASGSEMLAEASRPLSGRAARVYEIISSGDEFGEDNV
jgi:hypothetical protein